MQATRPTPRNLLIVELCRRLHNRLKARYLAWQLAHIRARLDELEPQMGEALQQAIDMARRHQHSPALQAHRREMRNEHTRLAAEWLRVRNELDALELS